MATRPEKILAFIERHKALDYEVEKKRVFINWLLRQYTLTCRATVIKAKKNEKS